MACTSQCAREYVWSARLHLVRHLRNISVIVDNLYQEEVLHNEEVDELETEKNDNTKKRKLMDLVIKKGEEACYKFLRIIDMTWKRASGRGSTLSETTEASSEFNLSFWISCFPFKEDAENYKGCLQGPRSCHEYQSKLKTKALKKSSEFWMTNKKLFDENYNPDLCYNPLVLDTQEREPPSKIKKFKSKKGKMSRPKKLKTYIPEGKPSMSLNYLVKTDKNILLVGKPGIGKTALCHEMLKLWAESENRELDYMFYFDMRETSHFTGRMSLEELLFSVYSEPDEGKEEVLRDIKKNYDHVTLIFDGITDLSSSLVKRIIKKDLLPDAKVILTCRPDNEDNFLSGDFVRVEVKGFSEQTIKNYFSVFLGENHKKVLCHLELFTLCHVPMYALMVAACFLSKTSEASPQPCSMTEIYINIVRYCLEMSRENKSSSLNRFIKEEKDNILSLAELAFHATKRKTVILTDLPYEDSCVLCFLKPLSEKVAPTETRKTYAFLHYTVQEFFAALWLLKNPDQIKDVFQQCLTEEGKHMKHLIPFMCRLLTEKSPSLLEHLIPAQELKSTSSWIFKDMISKFYHGCTEDGEPDADLLFVCQCLYESQCPAACVCFLETLDYHLDLSGESLDSYLCCAVANVVTLSKERKVRLNLEDVSVSEQGMTSLFGCLDNVLWCDPLPQQLWRIVFEGAQLNDPQLVSCDGNQFCLPLQGNGELCNGAADFLQKNQMKVDVCLHWDSRETTACPRLSGSLFKALPCISSLRFYDWSVNGVKLCGSLFCAAAERDQQTGEKTLELLASLCSHQIYPISFSNVIRLSPEVDTCDFLLDLCSYIKGHETKTGLSVLPSLKSVFKSAPSVWTIDLSKRKTSILLEVLKLQPEKKPVKLWGCSCEESEVRTFLQCLPYISQLRFYDRSVNGVELCGSLFCAAAERDQQTGEKTLELLASLCSYKTFPFGYSDKGLQSDFLLDLCSYIKDYETGSDLSVLPSLKSVFKSAPSVWIIDLSKRKTSILLEVLKLQPEKKSVELRSCSCEESEVRTFLQCLPYISELSVYNLAENGVKFCSSLFCAAAERDQRTGEKTLGLLASLCSYKTFPFQCSEVNQFDFLLGLCSYIKDYETKTGLSVLPSLKPVFKSAPSVWIIDLSKRKTSILLEVLRLQPEKKPVELLGCSCEESEVRTFLQCLPYISQLSFCDLAENGVELCGSLFCAAAERDQRTGEKTLELLASLCSYKTFPFASSDEYDEFEVQRCDFLLGLHSFIKDYETKTGLSVLQSLKPVFKSAPSVWRIDLSERKTSILLEVLKLQPEKKHVLVRSCSCEESEVRTFLQCLPYISELSCCPGFFQRLCECMSVRSRKEAEQLVSLLQLLGFSLSLREQLPSKLCKSVGLVLGLCGSKVDLVLKPTKISVREASLLFRHTRSLRSLRLSDGVALLLCEWVRRGRVNRLSVTGELSLSSQKQQPSERKMLRVVSSLASLLRYWKVRQLDLTESRIPAQSLIPFLLHEGPLTIRLSGEVSESLLAVLHETQDKDLTRSYLSKVGGDLTPVCLNWELLHHLLESSPQTVTVDLRKNSFLLESFTRLLAFLDRVLFKRLSPSFVLNAIKEIYRTRASPVIPALLKSFDHEINLTCREMDSEDCAALLYTLRHSDWVKLNLMWTSIPTEEINSILLVLEKVSQLSVDRDLLLRIVHCCAASAAPQDRAVSLLRSLQHRLDLSCSSHVKLSAGGQSETLCLSFSDCRAIVTVLRFCNQDTELQLQDCEVEDSGLDLLFPVLDRVQLKASKVVLLQMVSLVRLAPEWDSASRVRSLCGALGGELVLSHTKLDQMACEALALVLDYAEELTELDLSYCQLTNQLLVTLMENLHKVQVLDLSHNKITDESTSTLLGLVNINPNIETVRLFGNDIVDQTPFKALEQFEIW